MSHAQKVANRNIVFIGAFIVVWVVSAANVFTVFDVPLQEATGGSGAQIALALTIYQTVMALFGILSGRIVDKSGPKMLMFVGGAIFGLGYLLTGFVTSVPLVYITYGLMAGAGNGLMYNPAINTSLRWFPEKRATMNGVLLAAASIGGIILSQIATQLNHHFGQKGFVYLGIGFWVLAWLAGAIMSPAPANWRPAGYNPDAGPTGRVEKDFTPGQMIKTPTFWLMIVILAFCCTAGIMMIGKLTSIAGSQLYGAPVGDVSALSAIATTTSIYVIVNTAANLVGRLSTGVFADKFGEIKVLAAILILTIVSLLGLSVSTSPLLFGIFLCLLGASFGGVLVVFPPLTSRQFGLKNNGVNYGIMFFGYAIASLVGPQIASLLAVPGATGLEAYRTVYFTAAAVAAVGLVLVGFLFRIDKKHQERLHALQRQQAADQAEPTQNQAEPAQS
ncbi:MFS transporter, OFA family, oxalate/formate antiporter [Actinobaculum suis]|uniref:MFS transporter, OFA family, oxalate/formate antiporter n=1 Tax=Actinobaculum suis TaxID=1657 RepID=A0A1G7DIP6_9ACTO|nr:OFA family MFS transporter [Actinobaculum suis]MDY5154059.1 OFA family MFS transporter [Actinobaculum suis]SDE51418.1 MFS transporter, OFA family, oxalate/formate antiporter [Actinobaculum suis]